MERYRGYEDFVISKSVRDLEVGLAILLLDEWYLTRVILSRYSKELEYQYLRVKELDMELLRIKYLREIR